MNDQIYPGWLNNCIFYEIYPQSFKDSNADVSAIFKGSYPNWTISSNLAATQSGSIPALNLPSAMRVTTSPTIIRLRQDMALMKT